MKYVLSLILALALPAGVVFADTAQHTVTVVIDPMLDVNVSGDVSLSADAVSLTDSDSTSSIDWLSNRNAKITVMSSVSPSDYTLSVEAQNCSTTQLGSLTLAAVDLDASNPAADFITGITAGTGECDLNYTLTATLTTTPKTDAHTVTYTITGV